MSELERTLHGLLELAKRDPDHACAQFDLLAARHGRTALARALQAVAGDELATLTH